MHGSRRTPFFTERPESRTGRFQCPKCRRTNDYAIRWVKRAKKDRLPAGADDADRQKFSKVVTIFCASTTR